MEIIKYIKNLFTKKEKELAEENPLSEEFYSIIKMTSGEEILSLTMIDENEGEPVLVLQNPITIKVLTSPTGVRIKVKSWIEMSSDDFFIVKLDKIITMTETKDERLIEIFNSYLEDEDDLTNTYISPGSKSNKVKPSKKMGYISSVEDARKSLENSFNLKYPKES
jgi:hypothetical protein